MALRMEIKNESTRNRHNSNVRGSQVTKCIQCHKKYIAYDDDAGTWREHFCSEDCRDRYDKELNTLIQSPQQGVKADQTIQRCQEAKMAQRKTDVIVELRNDLVYPIEVWIDDPGQSASEIKRIEGVLDTSCLGARNPILVRVDPRYTVDDVAAEIEQLVTQGVPDVFDAQIDHPHL